MTDGSDVTEYQNERQNEIEADKARQRRIRDRVPGRRVNGNVRAGDIDGVAYMSHVLLTHSDITILFQAVLDQVKDGWEFIVDPDVRAVFNYYMV